MAVQYGVISDKHNSDNDNVKSALDYFKSRGVGELLVVGDIGIADPLIENARRHTGDILQLIAESGLTAYVTPGSHETIFGYGDAINWFAKEYPEQIIDATKQRVVNGRGHDLVFLPGTDFFCGGEYVFGNDEETGLRIVTSEGDVNVDALDYESFLKFGMENPDKKVLGVRHYFNINELRDLVKHPHKTIAVCHVPRKFDLEGCVDKGHFYQRRKYYKSKIEGVDDMWKYSELGVIPGFVDSDDLKGMGMPILDLEDEGDCIKTVEELEKNGFSTELYVEQIGNRGNKDLRSLFGSLGITKAVSGHFHESVHSANDSKGNPVEAGKFVRDLFWMGSHLDEKKIGILSVSGPMVSYENVVLS